MDKSVNIKIKINSEDAKLDTLNSKINSTSKGFSQADTVASAFTNRIIALGGAYLSLNAVINAGKMFITQADAMNSLDSRLKLATSSTSEYLSEQKKLLEISHDSYTSILDTTTLFTKLNPALKQAGANINQVNSVVGSFTKGLQLGGATVEESKSAILQFSQAMGSGVLRGEEFNAMAEASPKLMEYMAKGLSVPQTALRKIAEDGDLTAVRVSNALLKIKTDIEKDFLTMPVTVGKAMTNLKTDFSLAIADIDKATGATATLSGAIQNFTGNLSIYTSNTITFYKEATGFIDQHNQAISITSELVQVAIGSYLGYRVIAGVLSKTTEAMITLRTATAAANPIIGAVALAGYGLANSFIEGKTRTDNLGKSIDDLANSMTTFDLQTRLNEVNKELAGMDKNIAKYGDSQKLMYKGAYDFAYKEKTKLEESIKLINDKADAQKNAGKIKSLFDKVDLIPEKKKTFTDFTQEIQKQIDPIRAIHEEYNKLRKDIKGTELDTPEYNKNLNQKELDDIAKLDKEKISKAKELATEQKRIAKDKAEVEAEFNLIGLNDLDTKFKELENKYNADLVKYADVVGAKEKIDLVYKDNVKNLANQRNIETQKEDLSFFERKIQLMDDSISKELELQGVNYASRVLDIENSTKSIAEKDKLFAKETELFNLTVQSMNYKYDAEFQTTMSSFYDDMMDSQLALNSAVYDFGSGFDGVASNISKVSKSLAAMSSLELTNKREASKLDKKYIEQFNKYAGDVEKTGALAKQYEIDTGILKEQNIQAQIAGYANVAGAMSSMFAQGSRDAAAFQVVESSLALVAAVRAVATQGSGDPYTAFARIAAMTATMSSLMGSIGVAFGLNKTTTVSDSFSSQTANDGSGSVLGDSKKQSESITNALETLKDFANPEYQTLLSMNNYLATIANNIGGVASLLVQNSDYALGTGYTNTSTGYKNNVSSGLQSGIGLAGGVAADLLIGGSSSMGVSASLALTGASTLGSALLASTGIGIATMLADKFLLGGAISNMVGSVLGGVLGKTSVSQKLKDSGITFADQLLTSAIDEFNGSAYQSIATTVTKKSWFSKSSKTSIKSYFEDLDSETERQFSLVLDGFYNTTLTAGTALDSASETTAKNLENFVVSLGKISLKDKTGTEIQELLTNAFSEIGDDIASTAFPALTSFQHVGEGMFETLTRVATGMEEADYYVGRLGNKFSDITYTAINNKQGDVGFEALLQSIQAVEVATYPVNNNLYKIVENLDATAEELYSMYINLDELRDRLIFLKEDAQALSSSMIYGAGSVSELQSGLNAYFENFLTDGEQLAYQTSQISQSFNDLGIALPTSKDAFKALLSGIDETSVSGQELYGRLIILAKGFAEVQDSVADSITTLEESLSTLSTEGFDSFITSLDSVGQSIKSLKQTALSFINGFTTSNDATLEEQIISYNKLRATFSSSFDENGIIKAGANQDEVSSLYSSMTSLASSISEKDSYLKDSLISQVSSDLIKFNSAEDVLKVNIVDGLGSLYNLTTEQTNKLQAIAADGNITSNELSTISGLTQTQKDGILEFANNSDYFSTEGTLSSLNEYAKLQLQALQKTQTSESANLSSQTLTFGDYVGTQEQIDIAKLLGVSYDTAEPMIEKLQQISTLSNATSQIQELAGFTMGGTSYDETAVNQLLALQPYTGMNITGVIADMKDQITTNKYLEEQKAFESAKSDFYTRYEDAVSDYNTQKDESQSAWNVIYSKISSPYKSGLTADDTTSSLYATHNKINLTSKKYKSLYDSYKQEHEDAHNAYLLMQSLAQEKALKGYALGGYTGDGSANEIKGFVHAREHILDSSVTSQINQIGSVTDMVNQYMNQNFYQRMLEAFNKMNKKLEDIAELTKAQAREVQKIQELTQTRNEIEIIKTTKGVA